MDDAQVIVSHRSRRIRFASASIGAMLTATAGGIAAVAMSGGVRVALVAITAAAVAAMARRGLRLDLRATSDDVEVANFWRTYRFSWLDVERVGLGLETMGVRPRSAVVFGLRGGRTIRAQSTPEHVDAQRRLFAAIRRAAPPSVDIVWND